MFKLVRHRVSSNGWGYELINGLAVIKSSQR